MNTPSAANYVLPRWLRPWEQFWFTPADPTLLGLIRIACGMIVVYTLFAYSFRLQEFMGEHAWHDLQLQRDAVENRPVFFAPLNWTEAGQLPEAKSDFQRQYLHDYRKRWGFPPPPPYPKDMDEANYLDLFRQKFNIDLRINGLRPPANEAEKSYAEEYT